MSGTVVDESNGNAVAGAIVSLVPDKAFNPYSEVVAGETSVTGDFRISSVVYGRYFVEVTRRGYRGATSTIDIWAGQSRDGYRYKLTPTSTVTNCPKTVAGKPNPLCP